MVLVLVRSTRDPLRRFRTMALVAIPVAFDWIARVY